MDTDQQITYQRKLLSNSNSAKIFKKNVSTILTELHGNDMLEFSNDGLKSETINTPFIDSHIYSYESTEDVDEIKELIVNERVNIAKYYNKLVLYGFVMPLKLNHQYITVHFGYTDNIIHEKKIVEDKFQCKAQLIKLKLIFYDKIGMDLNQVLKREFPELYQQYTLDSKKKTGLFKVTNQLLDFIDSYPDEERKAEAHDLFVVNLFNKSARITAFNRDKEIILAEPIIKRLDEKIKCNNQKKKRKNTD
jgi:hypothetical protein